MSTVYILWHTIKLEDGDEHEKLLGVYTSKERMESAANRLENQPGFRDYRDNFFSDEYELDRDHWTEGFVDGQFWEHVTPPSHIGADQRPKQV